MKFTELSSKCKLFYINYPNDPTGAVATDKFYDDLIEYAKSLIYLLFKMHHTPHCI